MPNHMPICLTKSPHPIYNQNPLEQDVSPSHSTIKLAVYVAKISIWRCLCFLMLLTQLDMNQSKILLVDS